MCGRYVLTAPLEAIRRVFGVDPDIEIPARYNAAPTQDMPVVRRRAGEDEADAADGRRELVLLRWGLIPHWADDPAIGNRLINARAESVAVKPAFRESFRRRRCLVVADGFYEWKKEGGRKQPYLIRLKSGDPFGFAGLWSVWRGAEGERLETFTIITTEPNALCARLHNRMPAIVGPEDQDLWLDPDAGDAMPLLRPYASDAMEAFPVGSRVGNPRNDDPRLVEPLARQESLL